MNAGSALHRLAELLGIATEFWDWKHRHTQVPDETIIKVMAAMGVEFIAHGLRQLFPVLAG